MYLRQHTDKRINKTYLSIARGFRDINGKTKTTVVQNLGDIEELKKQYPDPIAHFKEIVTQMNFEEKQNKSPICLNINKSEKITSEVVNRKNFGYVIFSKLYHELNIDKFLLNKFKDNKISQHKINNIMQLLTYSRLLFPDSKKATYENKDHFFFNTDFSLKEMYNALSYIAPYCKSLQKHLYNQIKKQFGNNTECVYYDVTNYYFEIDEQDELRKKGVSKEHRPDPIIQMGLFLDTLGFPIAYKLFSGNTNDCLTLRPMIQELQKNYDIGKVIVVADKGLSTGNNISYNLAIGNGYVMSLSIRGGNRELKDFVSNEKGYINNGDTYKIKSRLYPREITITKNDGTKKKKRIDEKQVIFYSKDYDKKAKADRQPVIDKAKELIGNPTKFNKVNSYGATKYVKHLVFDNQTGEIIQAKSILSINDEKLKEEEKYDGYYAIVTSEYKKTDNEIIDIYRGLWKIEETFKVTKSDLEARPVYLSRQDRIETHFLICYVALVIARISQHRLNQKYSVSQIAEVLKNVCCTHIHENIYIFDYIDQILNDIGNAFNIDFTTKFLTLKEIKKILSTAKRLNITTIFGK